MDREGDCRIDGRRFSSTEVLLIALMLAALLAASAAPALRRDASAEQVPTRPVLVRSGDTLWSLARANPVPGLGTARTAHLIREVNGLASSAVLAGDILLVPDTTGSASQLALRWP